MSQLEERTNEANIIMADALEAFGSARQIDKCIEELGELTTALMKWKNGEAGADAVIDELADVAITGGTMKLLFDPHAVDERIAVKLARLVRLVADQVQANAEKPKPVKPVLRWEQDGDDMTLYDGGVVGWVSWWPDLGKWVGNPYGKTAGACGAKSDAKRHVEMACGFDEVAIWTP